MTKQTGVGGCGGGCSSGNTSQDIVPPRHVLERLSPTPAQAANMMRNAGTYGDWVTDVPIQGPTDPGIRAADCWWKKNVIDRAVTDEQGAMVPRWTQHSLCVDGRPCVGMAGVGELISRGGVRVGALGQSPPAAAPAAPGLWSDLSAAESQWVAVTLVQLNALILKAGNKPCATWPANPTTAMPAAVGCFQGWFNTNGNGSLRTDGVLDRATLCSLVAVTKQHATDFPTPYPGSTLPCLSTLPLPIKIGIGVLAAAMVGGTAVAIAGAYGKKKPAAEKLSEARRAIGYQVLVFNQGSSRPEVVTRVNTEAEAERLKAHYEKQADQRGWNKRVEIRPVRG
jgi:hypothetical protein